MYKELGKDITPKEERSTIIEELIENAFPDFESYRVLYKGVTLVYSWPEPQLAVLKTHITGPRDTDYNKWDVIGTPQEIEKLEKILGFTETEAMREYVFFALL